MLINESVNQIHVLGFRLYLFKYVFSHDSVGILNDLLIYLLVFVTNSWAINHTFSIILYTIDSIDFKTENVNRNI